MIYRKYVKKNIVIYIILYVFDGYSCGLIPPAKYKSISMLSGLFRSRNLSHYNLYYIIL